MKPAYKQVYQRVYQRAYRPILQSPLLLSLVVLVNLGGTVFGFYYYWAQLMATNPILWVFVPDCPLYTLLFVPAVVLLRVGRLPRVFGGLVAAGLVKYGLWTVFVILYYSEYFLAPASRSLYLVLLFLHVGMAVEAGLVLDDGLSGLEMWVVLGWLLVNDLVDYGLGVHPIIPISGMGVVIGVTVLLSLASTWAVSVKNRLQV